MTDDGESAFTDPASSQPVGSGTAVPSPAPGWLRAAHAVQALALAVLLVITLGGGLSDGAGRTLVRTSAVVVLGIVAALFLAAAARRFERRPLGSGHACLGLSALAAAGAVATGLTGVAAETVLVGVALLQAAGLALLLRAPVSRLPPGRNWDVPIVAIGATGLGTAGFGLALATAGAAVPVSTTVPVACTTGVAIGSLIATALAGSGLGSPAHRPDLSRIAVGLTLVAIADQVSLATRGLPALVPGPDTSAHAGSAALAASGFLLAALAAADRLRGRALDRRLPVGTGRRFGPAAVLAGISVVLVVIAIVYDGSSGRTPAALVRGGALLALGCLVLSVLRVDRLARTGPAIPPGDFRPRTDDLTGLANRRALSEALAGDRMPDPDVPDGDATGWSGWAGWADEIALLLVDLDHFKDVNEALGHEAGDRLLTAVGTRLRTALRPTQLLARLGGDEFAVVLPAAGPEQAERVAQGLRDSLSTPFEIDGTRLHVQASIGMASCHPSRGEPKDLLRQADVAMYQAKAAGTGVAMYDPSRDDGSSGDRLRRTDELRDALQRGDLEVHLQPQVDLRTGAIVGAEALARWRHPQDGVLLPDSFLPLAEHTGLMRPVTALLLDRALEACATWWDAGSKVTVSVNLGAEDLRDQRIGDRVRTSLAKHGLPPAALRVEITEQALLRDPAAVATILRRWRSDGVAVAIDDFGTGYSSLSYLRELPIDEVKLDRSFIADIARSTTATIVRHTAAMAHGLDAVVVAEGIEDEQTARRIAELGCDVGQGIYFGSAMTPAQFVARLAEDG